MIAFLLIATAPVDMQVRVIQAGTQKTYVDPKLKDVQALFKSLAFTSYELKEQTALKLQTDGPAVAHKLPGGRTLNVAAKGGKKKLQVELEIPELKFKTKAQVAPGASLVVGGPKFEDGVLLFALTLTP